MSDLPLPDIGVGRDDADLVTVLSELGAVVLAAETVESIVELVTSLAAVTIPGTSGAGVTLVDERGHRSLAASDASVEQADALQYEFESGPCLTAWRDQVRVRIDDLTTESRWQQWCSAAADLGVRAVLSVPLTADGRTVGAMKVYSNVPGAYDAHAEQVLELFARQAAILLVNMQSLVDARRLSGQLRGALLTRDVIGQAKGILMAQGARGDQAAFVMLTSASQRTNVKVSEVARQLIESVLSRQRGDQQDRRQAEQQDPQSD